MYAETLTAANASVPADTRTCDPLDELFEQLHDAGWDARALTAALAAVERYAHQLTPQWRTAWLSGLRECWRRHGWALSPETRVGVMDLAARWDDWPLVVGIGEGLAGDGQLPDDQRLRLAHAWRRLGDGPSAVDHARRYLLTRPHCPRGQEEYTAIQRWRAFRAHHGLDQTPIDEDGLFLEPLAHHHLEDFAWQYHDPEIAELCCLPHFEDDEQWHRWLDRTYGYGDQLPFAVIDHQWGFIGVVSLILHDQAGFFYYWIGTDFQGNGFGPRAVSLLLNHAAERWGMTTCYAKVFDYNTPSRRALAKLGFEELGIRAAPPDERELFYRLGEPFSRERTVGQLHRLLEQMGSSTMAAAPLVAG